MCEISRVATGVDWFDAKVQHGIPKNKVTLVIGESGVGKTIFGLQFLKTGLFTDERVVYFTAKDSPIQVLSDISCLEWDLEWALDQERFKIVDIRDYFRNVTEEDIQSDLLANFFNEIENIIRTNNIKRLVFDPVIPFSLLDVHGFYYYYINELVKFLESSSLQVTSLLIHTARAEQRPIEEIISTNVVHMFFSKENNLYERTLLVQKMQNTYYQPEEIFFDIIPKDGMVLKE